ncbi:radical SAM family heme chaperone HemW [Pusillimonas sp. NJUB218]|uniref:radical SAM family heme chaperone HemW n=1 Tax=Pusillimonas sp. NJUB218 TaxID=2023230 RepID=UPI000F4C2153|nr:radical SAM family heme chaperone HemW [Pusillimonas sp. NJUB218]ROT45322.1 YggW family oxidoreductase [Pusillimonas sp. NJUB218]
MRTIIPIQPANAPASAAPATPAGVALSAGSGITLTSLPPLSLYVHVPWCVRKCPYCDFNSHELKGDLPEAEYLSALQADLEQALPLIWGRPVVSIFIGGGTPSLLSAQALDQMLAMFRACLTVLPGAEITLEANPGTAEAGRFRDFAASGVSRISLGIQSFSNAALKALGRIHDADQARAAIAMAQAAVPRVNLDLMFALPDQTLDQCDADLAEALAFGTEHLSLYNLTLEPNTVFAKYPPNIPSEDDAAIMQERVADTLAAAGYERYEVSAYARPGKRCLHNLNYWEFGDYLGIGPGAHGKLSFHDRIIRQARLKNPASWMTQVHQRDGSHLAQDDVVPAQDLPFEFMLNALRLRSGVSAATFTERTGVPVSAIAPAVDRAVRKGLLVDDPTRFQATALGWQFLNDLQSEFLD